IFMVPLYRSRALLTAYEYLEGRFGPETRALASLVFLSSRCMQLAIALGAPAVALSAIFGMPTTASLFLIGGLATLYTMVGGVAAAIWTDVKQMTVIIFGMLAVLVILLWDLLPHFSLSKLLEVAGAAGKLNAVAVVPDSTDFLPRSAVAAAAGIGLPSFWEQKYNLWSGLFGGFFLHLAYFGCDFSQAQRILTSKNKHDSRFALLLSAFVKVPMQTLILSVGVLIWLFYAVHGSPMLFKPEHLDAAKTPQYAAQVAAAQQQYDAAQARRRERMQALAALPGGPTSDPALLHDYQAAVAEVAGIRKQARELFAVGATAEERKSSADDTNFVFVRYILDNLPHALLGLVIAAIFAAAMASSSAELNALSAAAVNDGYKRWIARGKSEAHYVLVGRLATLAFGMFASSVGMFMLGGGSLIENINIMGSFFYGSLLGVFALAMLVRRARRWAGAIGLVAGMATVAVVHNTLKIEFLWYNVVGCLAVLVVGILVSCFERAPRPSATAS
ncbi:MAG TPA: sodium:solute symporter, partial [Planctomycetota bacterium]|nr:sodium:solute symporter [Planctomycetota bacterium]